MSLYVPAMQSNDKSQMIYSTSTDGVNRMAKSFLDGVRMAEQKRQFDKRMENEAERIRIQKYSAEEGVKAKNRALDISEKQFDMQNTMFNQNQQARKDREAIAQGLVKKNMKDSEFSGAVNEELNTYGVGTNMLGLDVDENKNRLYIGAPDVEGKDEWELFQWASPKEIATAKAKEKGFEKGAMDPELLKTIKDPSMLDYLPMFGGNQEGQGNMLYNAIFNNLFGD